jgi:acyl-CoA synthetase (AMP-forming)/AMP-acid ligase II
MTMYGATETAPLVTTLPRLHRLLDAPQARSCGRPAVGVEVRVVADDGGDAPVGEVGEVTVRGPNVMAGYWNKPEQTAAVLRDGWYSTGDLGRLDEDGYLYLVDRAKDMIVTGGENVYSTEVEEVLFRHPGVLEAAVFGVPDARWGEAVHAVVVPRAGAEPHAEELVAWCRESIAGYKVPKVVELRSEPLPKSGAGKVLKRELRAPYWEGTEASVSGA